MIDLAAASVLVRELTEQHLTGANATPPGGARAKNGAGPLPGSGAATATASGASAGTPPAPLGRPTWIGRVASLLTRRSTEETWPRRKSRTSAC
jgi:hypothetical protein